LKRKSRDRCLSLLRSANGRLERFFARCLRHNNVHPDHELRTLLHVERIVRAVGAQLHKGLEPADQLVIHEELARYHANLVRLRHALAGMQAGVCGYHGRLFIGPKPENSPPRTVLPSRAVN